MDKQLTPKEKAEELVNKFEKYSPGIYWPNGDGTHTYESNAAKQCALIAVDEILNNFGLLTNGKHHFCDYATISYYEEVKQEIITYNQNK